MKFTTRHLMLVSILALAAFLRLWSIEQVPPTVSMDEASIAYNAFSVVKTRADEYGDFPFVSQRGYDDWRRSTYLFLVAPFVALFNLRPLSVRLPAVFLSVLSVWAIYHIILLLFTKRTTLAYSSAALGALFLAISPWHVYISRLGHESNAYISFFIFAVLFFFQGLKRVSKFLVSFLFFMLSMISYYAGQILVPLFGLGALFLYRRHFFSLIGSDKKFRFITVLSMALAAVVCWSVFTPTALVRFRGTSIFNPDAHFSEIMRRTELWNKAVENNDIAGTIVNSKYFFPLSVWSKAYISHFNPSWLFFNSSAEPFKVPHMGLLYIWQIPLAILGIIYFFADRQMDQRAKGLIFLWFILSPLPGSVATQAPHAMRAFPMVIPLQIFTAFGIALLISSLKRLVPFIAGTTILLVVWSLCLLYPNYFTAFPREQSQSFHFALSKAIPYVIKNEEKFKKIVFSNEENLYQSYMVFLYYSRLDPQRYQQLGGTVSGGYAETHAFSKYEFRPITKSERLEAGVLYIGNQKDFNPQERVLERFFSLDGTPSIYAVVAL